jgi:GAF domain-containing protein
VLCIPLLAQGHASGVLYLENTQQAGVFTAERVLMLELLAAHGAAALDNVRLTRQLADDKARTRAQEAAHGQTEAERIGERR